MQMTFLRAYVAVCVALTVLVVAAFTISGIDTGVIIAVLWVAALFPSRWIAKRMSRRVPRAAASRRGRQQS